MSGLAITGDEPVCVAVHCRRGLSAVQVSVVLVCEGHVEN